MPGVIMRRRAVGIDVVLRQTFAHDVSVGNHTDETVVLSWSKLPFVTALMRKTIGTMTRQIPSGGTI
jgi:hypothetical protein